MRINILDYNCGNIWSIKNIFSYLNIKVEIIKTEKEIINSDCLILPGDGSFKIIDDIKITPVEHADEVLKIALTKELKRVEWVEVEKISKTNDKSQASIQ